MTIGINAAAAIKQPRTGVEEYVYQLIKHLTMLPEAREHRFLLYVPKKDANKCFDFPLPENFEVRQLKWPLPMWTQIRLAIEMMFHKPDSLFVPAHILPLAHPKNSIVSVLGLEYEYYPETYSFFRRLYLRFVTKLAVKRARKIIAISENTKKDLVKLYGVAEERVEVVHLGALTQNSKRKTQSQNLKPQTTKPYLLYVGRIETKKNVQGILGAYKILKEKYRIPHKLVLAGPPGFGYEKVMSHVARHTPHVQKLGYVSEAQKQQLLQNADVFLFPSFYEGFGIPILEAQAAGAPTVTSNVSCMPEVAGSAALLADPKNHEEIAQAVFKIIDDKTLRDKLIQLGFENIKRFSWERCAKETLKILVE